MTREIDPTLTKELRLAGASTDESKALVALASKIKQLRTIEDHRAFSYWRRLVSVGLASISGLATGMVVIIFSQAVLPTSWLYPVQELSDNAAIMIHPEYRGVVMMKRAEQVKQLVMSGANSKVVLATLADYQKEALAYKSVSNGYAAFEYCKTNLEQAVSIAPPTEKQAINSTLAGLQDV